MHHAGLSDGGEPQPGSTCALAGLQHIARASPEQCQGQSLEVAQQKFANIRKGFVHKSSNDPNKNHVAFVEDCPSGICRSQRAPARKTTARTSSRSQAWIARPVEILSLQGGGSQEMAETPAVLFHASPALPPAAPAVDRSRRYLRILLILFLCTLPLVNPIVHGDGVGYYAYVRAPLIEHNFRFHTRPSTLEYEFSRSARG